MEIVNCPYCGAEITLSAVEKNAGSCPECDATVTGSLFFAGVNAEDDDEAEVEDNPEHLADEDAHVDIVNEEIPGYDDEDAGGDGDEAEEER